MSPPCPPVSIYASYSFSCHVLFFTSLLSSGSDYTFISLYLLPFFLPFTIWPHTFSKLSFLFRLVSYGHLCHFVSSSFLHAFAFHILASSSLLLSYRDTLLFFSLMIHSRTYFFLFLSSLSFCIFLSATRLLLFFWFHLSVPSYISQCLSVFSLLWLSNSSIDSLWLSGPRTTTGQNTSLTYLCLCAVRSSVNGVSLACAKARKYANVYYLRFYCIGLPQGSINLYKCIYKNV